MTATAAAPTMLTAKQIHDFATSALRKLGMPDDDASILADAWTWAGRRGKPTHSIIRLLQVAPGIRAGHIGTHNDWRPVAQRGGTTLLDARDAYGVVAGSRGMRIAIDKAREHGVGVTVIRNCDNTGALGMFPAIAVAEKMIGMTNTNSIPLMAAWGGAKKIIGNQAFAIGAPAGKHPPLILDMASSAASLGVVRERAATGEPLPPGVAVDANGAPTVDARVALEGMMLPMGGHRGFGLAVMWEVFTGVLSGGKILDDITPQEQPGQSQRVSLFVMAMDPSAFMPYEEFTARVDELIDRLHASPTAPGFDRVRVPGETGGDHWARNAERIPVSAADLEKLRPLAAELGVELPS